MDTLTKHINPKFYKHTLVILFTVLIFWVIFSKIGFGPVFLAVKNADKLKLAAALFASLFVNIIAGPFMWGLVLKFMGFSIPLKSLIYIVAASAPVRYVMPLKSGEIFKAVYLDKYFNVPFEKGVSSAIFDKATNLFGLLLLISAASLVNGGYLAGLIFLLALAAGLILLGLFKKLNRYFDNERFNSKFASILKGIFQSIAALSLKQKILIIALTALFQMSHILNAWLVFGAVGLDAPLSRIFVYAPVIVLITNIPITIAGLGTREAAFIAFFGGFAAASVVFGAGMLVSFVEYVIPLIVGLFMAKSFVAKIL